MSTPEQLPNNTFYTRTKTKIKEMSRNYRDESNKLKLKRLLKRIGFEKNALHPHQQVQDTFVQYFAQATAGLNGFRYSRDESDDYRFAYETIYKGEKEMASLTLDFHPDAGMPEKALAVRIETNEGFRDVGLKFFTFPFVDGKQEAPILEGGFFVSDGVAYFASDDPQRIREKKL